MTYKLWGRAGWGSAIVEAQLAWYGLPYTLEPVEFAGIKLFYKQDVPLMTPADILGLTPPPDVIIYQ